MAQLPHHISSTDEEHLTRVLSASHCLLWEATVTEVVPDEPSLSNLFNPETGTILAWDIRVLLPETIQRWLPLAWSEGQNFANAFVDARDEEDWVRCDTTCYQALRTGAPSYCQSYRLVCADGRRVWIQESVSITLLAPGKWQLTGVCTDITVLKGTEEALDRVLSSSHCILWHAWIEYLPIAKDNPRVLEEAQGQGTLESGHYFAWDIQLVAEEMVRTWLPVPSEPGQAYSDALYLAIEREDRLASDRKSTHALQSGLSGYTQELRLRTLSGELRWLQEDVQLKPLGGNRWYAAGINTDITERKESESRLVHQANHDHLTGLANRRYLLDALKRLGGHTAALLFIDIDNFKLINDNFGHLFGDQVLVGMAERLRSSVAGRGLLCRLGGDEFTILLPYVAAPQEALALAQRITERLRQPLTITGSALVLSGSIGIAFGSAVQPEDLLRNANTAMHHAKSQGKAHYCFFDPQMDIEARERFELERALRQAIAAGEIVPHYQPILELGTGEIVAIEALARWQTKEGGYLSPARFIPIAEETGLILPLGAQLLRQACRDMARWRAESAGSSLPVSVNVNVSERQFHDPQFVSLVTQTLQETGLPPTALTLELTESILLQDTDGCLSKLQELDTLGVHLALDDFGTGYSSLSYLSRLPVHALKIDRSFVSALTDSDPKAQAQSEEIIRAIIALAQALGLKVTAEGIEQQNQCLRLQLLGAHYGQGYLFTPPVPAATLTNYLTQKTAPPLRRAA